MESLDLPKELYWDLKREPASPPTTVASELFALDEPTVANFLYDDNFAHGISIMSDDEAESLREAVSMELLSGEDLVVEFYDLKDEECLLDQKAPHYIEYETASFPQHLDVVSQALLPITKGQVAEFQHCDASFTLQQLTPPQSPPQFHAYQQQQQQQELVKKEQEVQPYVTDAAAPTPAVAPSYSFTNNWVPVNDNVREAQLVDDIVNMRAKELELPNNWQLYNDDCESQASSSTGSNSSHSDTSGTGSSVADVDEEWLPETSNNSPAHSIEEEQSTSTSTSPSSSGSAKKRTRTYGRGVEDRKIRKKEQNKNAATRYRQKKKVEMEHVLGEEQELMQANEELRRTLIERRNESRYLRQLIREFYEGRKK